MKATSPECADPLLRAVGLQKKYAQSTFWNARSRGVHALDGVDLELPRGSCSALVGASGSGKSTLAMCLAALDTLDEGEIWFEGIELTSQSERRLRSTRARIQVIFQDASGSLNPGFTAAELVEEPLRIQKIGSKVERAERAAQILQRLGITSDRHMCRPHEFSGGQLRRIGLARALVLDPALMILDEVFSGLDLTTASRILQELLTLRAERNLTLLFISHDLGFLQRAVDQVFVMQGGKIVERGTPARLAHAASHPHTRALLSAHAELHRGLAEGAGR